MNTKKSGGPVVERELWVENRLGIHARPAMKITNLALQFEADLILEKDSLQVNARDLLAILTLDCPQGTRLVLRACGSDANEAALAVCQLFARKFGES
jgi:phosphocarrier protein HPr